MKNSGLLVLIVILVVVGIAFAGWDYTPPPKPAQDIIDKLLTVPAPTLDRYGHTERTRVLFNIAMLLEICQKYEVRIKALEGRVAKLEEQVILVDPNEVLDEMPKFENTNIDPNKG